MSGFLQGLGAVPKPPGMRDDPNYNRGYLLGAFFNVFSRYFGPRNRPPPRANAAACPRPATIVGRPDEPHEGPQLLRFLQLMDGGEEFEFHPRAQGIEGIYTPAGGGRPIPLSMKDYTRSGSFTHLIGDLNQNARKISATPHAGEVWLYANAPSGVTSQRMFDFIHGGPIVRMPSEGAFKVLLFQCSDGVVVVTRSGTTILH